MSRRANIVRALLTAACCAGIVFLLGQLWSPGAPGNGRTPAGRVDNAREALLAPPLTNPSVQSPVAEAGQLSTASQAGLTPAEPAKAAAPPPTFRLAGVVIDSQGKAIPRATVKAFDTGSRTPRGRTARSDADGRFVIVALSAGDWRVVCGAHGFRPQRCDVAIPHSESVEFALERDSGLAVWVSNGAGDPVAGARVELRTRRHGLSKDRGAQTTDASGAARVTGLPEWDEVSAQLVVTHADYVDYQRTLGPGSLAGPVRVTLSRGGLIRGTVLTASGDPCRGAHVYLVSREKPSRRPRSLRTVTSGEFSFGKVASGSYRLEVATINAGTAVAEVTVGAEASPPPLSIPLQEGPQKITGIIRDSAGDPVVLCPVRVVEENREGARELRTVANEEGRFEVRGLAEGRYRVEAGGDRRYSLDRRTNLGAETSLVELRVDRLGSIEGRLEGFDTAKIVAVRLTPADGDVATIRPRNVALSGTRDRFRVPYLPPAEYRLEVIGRDGEKVGLGSDLRVESARVAKVVVTRE